MPSDRNGNGRVGDADPHADGERIPNLIRAGKVKGRDAYIRYSDLSAGEGTVLYASDGRTPLAFESCVDRGPQAEEALSRTSWYSRP